jgi:hypothetical protein
MDRFYRKYFVTFLSILIIFATLPIANARQINYIQLTHSTILNPIVITSTSNNTVDFVSYFVTTDYKPTLSDLICRNNFTQKDPVISETAPNKFSVLCRFDYDSSTPAGIWQVTLSTINSSTMIVPANAQNLIDVQERDNFGQIANVNYLAYEIFSRGAILSTASFFVNPPDSVSYPDLPKEAGAYIVFDARESEKKDMKVTLNRKKKTFSVSCPDMDLPSSLTKYGKIYSRTLHVSDRYTLNLGPSNSQKTFSYSGPFFQRKKLKLSCMYFLGMKNEFLGSPLRYFESRVLEISFPKI